MKHALAFLSLVAALIFAPSLATPAVAQPCQWNYALVNNVATATYCGVVVSNGGIIFAAVPNITALRAIPSPIANQAAIVVGSQGGTFTFSASNCPAADSGTQFPPSVGSGCWLRQFSGAVQVPWFETSVGTDDTAATRLALATGNDVYFPTGTYKLTDSVTISKSFQRVFGNGKGTSHITCVMPTSRSCLVVNTIVPGTPTEHVMIDHLWIDGTTNTLNLIEVAGPQLVIADNKLYSFTTGGNVIYIDNENSGAGVFVFGTVIQRNAINGSLSGDAIRIGNNANTTWIIDNTEIYNANNLIHFDGQVINAVVQRNNLAHSGNAFDAILFDNAATPTIVGIDISANYFENVHSVFSLCNARISNLRIANNYTTIGSATPQANSAFYTSCGGSALSRDIEVTNNWISGFNAAFQLNSEPNAAALISTKGNYLDATTHWAQGTYQSYAFTTRVTNIALVNPVFVSGAIATRSIAFSNIAAADLYVPLQWASNEVGDNVRFGYTPHGGGAQVVAKVWSLGIDSTGPTQIGSSATCTLSADCFVDISDVKALPNTQYYLELIESGGTSGDIYPVAINLRQ